METETLSADADRLQENANNETVNIETDSNDSSRSICQRCGGFDGFSSDGEASYCVQCLEHRPIEAELNVVSILISFLSVFVFIGLFTVLRRFFFVDLLAEFAWAFAFWLFSLADRQLNGMTSFLLSQRHEEKSQLRRQQLLVVTMTLACMILHLLTSHIVVIQLAICVVVIACQMIQLTLLFSAKANSLSKFGLYTAFLLSVFVGLRFSPNAQQVSWFLESVTHAIIVAKFVEIWALFLEFFYAQVRTDTGEDKILVSCA